MRTVMLAWEAAKKRGAAAHIAHAMLVEPAAKIGGYKHVNLLSTKPQCRP